MSVPRGFSAISMNQLKTVLKGLKAMKVLLSIKPEFALTIFKNRKVKRVVVYASSPVKKVIGEFEIEAILFDDPATLWQRTKKHSGITEEFFFQYFNNKHTGYAIKVKSTRKYRQPLCIREDFNATPPQSFIYI